jgi:hypothetical protein
MFHSVLNVKVGAETINSRGRGSGKSKECQGYCFVRYHTYRYSNKTHGFAVTGTGDDRSRLEVSLLKAFLYSVYTSNNILWS